MNTQEMSNVAKQILIVFKFMNKELINKIPRSLIEHLQMLSIDANIKFKYEDSKSLDEQDLLDETKDLLAVIFYSYIANDKEKEETLKSWNDNENKYNEIMLKAYNPNFELMHNNVFEEQEKALIKSKKTKKLYERIKEIVSRIFKQ